MRVLSAVLLLSVSMSGCAIVHLPSIHDAVEAYYQRCLAYGNSYGTCNEVRAKGYENVHSLSFLMSWCNAANMFDGCHGGGGSVSGPVPVIILN